MPNPALITVLAVAGVIIVGLSIYEIARNKHEPLSTNASAPHDEKHGCSDDDDDDGNNRRDINSRTTGFQKAKTDVRQRGKDRMQESEMYELEERERSIFARKQRIEEEERNLREAENRLNQLRERLRREEGQINKRPINDTTESSRQEPKKVEDPFADPSASISTSIRSSATEIPSILPSFHSSVAAAEIENSKNTMQQLLFEPPSEEKEQDQNPFDDHSASTSASFHSTATDIPSISSAINTPVSSTVLTRERATSAQSPTEPQPVEGEQLSAESILRQLGPEVEAISHSESDSEDEAEQPLQSSMQFPRPNNELSDSEESWADVDKESVGSYGRSRAQSDASEISHVSSSSLHAPRSSQSDDGHSYDMMSLSDEEDHGRD
ncbi:hypothetical protein EC973_004261 [Apophysomyces ossiformis]|uniref:Uncharacterized protein n=1 Tax=Apophysomyces ossiformis TaxID=679940 RepID=A0A8H7BKS3_9FUNG|nr:hypothetical protein EC973_004261 [Apophysomyces ossiformis]